MMDHTYPFQALLDACNYAHHPALHYDTELGIVKNILWQWEAYPSTSLPFWGRSCKYAHRSAQDTYEILHTALKEERVFLPLRDLLLEGFAARRLLALCMNSVEAWSRLEKRNHPYSNRTATAEFLYTKQHTTGSKIERRQACERVHTSSKDDEERFNPCRRYQQTRWEVFS